MLSWLIIATASALRAPPGRPPAGLPKKPRAGGRSIDTAELFVANLPDDSERDDFLTFARSAFPAVRRVTLPRDRSTGAARGFAFVEVPRDDVPAAVKAFDGAVLGSKRLKARPADKRAAAAPPDRSDTSSYAVNQRLAA